MILRTKRRFDYRPRFQAYEGTADGMLLQYLINLDSRSANSLIFQHLRLSLLPLVYLETTTLTPEQLKFKAQEAVTALEDYTQSIRELFHIEKQTIPVAIVSNGNGTADANPSRHPDRANSNEHPEKAHSNGHPEKAHSDEHPAKAHSDGHPEETEDPGEDSFFLEGLGTPSDCDQFFIGLD